MSRILEVLKELIYEMSYERQVAKNKFVNNSYAINSHIMKLILWGWNTDWAKTVYDISSYLSTIKVKPKGRMFTKQEIDDLLFKSHFDTTSDFVKSSVSYGIDNEDEYGKVKELSNTQISKKYNLIKDIVLAQISTNQINKQALYSKIRQIVGE